jgi:hypothetical protein
MAVHCRRSGGLVTPAWALRGSMYRRPSSFGSKCSVRLLPLREAAVCHATTGLICPSWRTPCDARSANRCGVEFGPGRRTSGPRRNAAFRARGANDRDYNQRCRYCRPKRRPADGTTGPASWAAQRQMRLGSARRRSSFGDCRRTSSQCEEIRRRSIGRGSLRPSEVLGKAVCRHHTRFTRSHDLADFDVKLAAGYQTSKMSTATAAQADGSAQRLRIGDALFPAKLGLPDEHSPERHSHANGSSKVLRAAICEAMLAGYPQRSTVLLLNMFVSRRHSLA